MSLRLHNTLSKKVEAFRPIEEGKVKMFVCGPTVYDYSHVGHAKTYVQLDVLARVLKQCDYDTFYLQNITDIDDKILARANEQKISWQDLADKYQAAYQEDMISLNNTSVTEYAKATGYIPQIIDQVSTLLAKNFAYEIPGDGIYFEIATFPDYGKLSGRTEIKEDDAQSRIDQSEGKRGWNDFCLWKFSKVGEPSWEAPFGAGRPGWHIEDTAIAEHFFGPQYDLHGGAVDLIFPHHEAEITQMEAASGLSPYVRYWVHTGFLTMDSRKMSKSLNNFHTIRDVIALGYDPMAIRLYMLQAHYRSPIDFTIQNLEATKNHLRNWRNIAALRHQTHDTIENDDEKDNTSGKVSLYATGRAIMEALEDDLNTPKALSIIDEAFNLVQDASLADIHRQSLVELLELIDEVLGLRLLETTPDLSDEQKQLIITRLRARESQDWATSDAIRQELEADGIALRDTSAGTIWEYSS